jgi:ubiquinone/menaquinone biosynthesis C-methylase UbiE
MAVQLFEPWARELVRRAGPVRGVSALDVASGSGVVARLVAVEVGGQGRVVASDISAAMLAVAATKPVEPGSARIEYLACSASALDVADESVQLVLCQHGLQFFADGAGALREMYRVLEPGGVAVVSTWAAERPLGLFGPMCDTLREAGIDAPYARAFDPDSYRLGVEELHELMLDAGFGDIAVDTVELDCVWESASAALAAISGTPYGPVIAALPSTKREAILAILQERLGGAAAAEVILATASNIARGVK